MANIEIGKYTRPGVSVLEYDTNDFTIHYEVNNFNLFGKEISIMLMKNSKDNSLLMEFFNKLQADYNYELAEKELIISYYRNDRTFLKEMTDEEILIFHNTHKYCYFTSALEVLKPLYIGLYREHRINELFK